MRFIRINHAKNGKKKTPKIRQKRTAVRPTTKKIAQNHRFARAFIKKCNFREKIAKHAIFKGF